MCEISIIVPVYNVGCLVRRCVNSIINQTYKKIEVILVDDGSSDESSSICDELGKLDNRIRVFHKPNGGLSDARNFGIKKSKGHYLMFIDSDDVVHHDFCRVLIEKIKEHDADIASTEIFNFYDDKDIIDILSSNQNTQEYILTGREVLSEYLYAKKDILINHGVCNKMFKKELFLNIWFPIGKLHEDLFTTYKLLLKCSKYVYLKKKYYFYYQSNKSSICTNYTEKNMSHELEALNEIERELKEYSYWRRDLLSFCAIMYKDLIIKSVNYNLKSYKNINRARKWILRNILKRSNISLLEKIKIILLAVSPQIYIDLKDIYAKKILNN